MVLVNYSQILIDLKSAKFIIIDENVYDLYSELRVALKDHRYYLLSSAEESKSFTCFEAISTFFIEAGITRNDELFVIGGGATSDLGGFVASTVLRGIHWRVYPTTLLGMIDASIGGKVGINTKHGKNLVGNFHLPVEVKICFEFLKTLPDIEIISGKGELLKYCFLSKEIHDETLSRGFTQNLLLMCARYKQEIVENDFKEQNLRKILNFGHTFGHAIEKSTKLPHGVSVGHGIKFILEVFNPEYLELYNQLCHQIQIELPKLDKMNKQEFNEYLFADKKKNLSGDIEFILVNTIGKAQIKAFGRKDILDKISESSYVSSFF